MRKSGFMKIDKSQMIMNKYSQMISNVLLGIFCLLFVIIYARQFLLTSRPSLALYMVLNGIYLIFALKRRPAKEVDIHFFSWLFTFAGTLLPILALPSSTKGFFLGYFLQTFGIIISIVGICSLNKSFGLLAANRGIVTSGLFKFVRHPLYFSYSVSILGFVLNNCNFYNVFLFSTHFFCQIQRIKYEEKILAKDPKYRSYMTNTKYRLIPYVY